MPARLLAALSREHVGAVLTRAMQVHGDTLVIRLETTAAGAAVAGMGEDRPVHFEQRYRSIDQALEAYAFRNVVEIGAGLSFRGLAMARTPGIHFLDTDLPELLAAKADLVARIAHPPLPGTLRLEPLDVLAAGALADAVRGMPAGPVAIVNEGLLMYLDADEKARLAGAIRACLRSDRGARWITADCHVRDGDRPRPGDPALARFIAEHRVEEQKFASWEAAEHFFEVHGFAIERRLDPGEPRHVRETWVLAAA